MIFIVLIFKWNGAVLFMKKCKGIVLSESVIGLFLSLLALVGLLCQLQATINHLNERINKVQLKQVAIMSLRELHNTQQLKHYCYTLNSKEYHVMQVENGIKVRSGKDIYEVNW